MALVPLLIGCQTYCLLRLVSTDPTRSVFGLALASGISFWTLYLPFIFAMAVTAFVIVLPRGILDVRRKLAYLVGFLVIAAPTVGKLIQFPQVLLRHRDFLLKVGEASGLKGTLGADYLHNAQLIVASLWPDIGLFVGGILLGWQMLTPIQRVVVYGSCAVQFATIVVSNPVVSVWRQTALWPSLMLFAGLCYAWIGAQLDRLNRPKTAGCVLGGIMAVHVLAFMRYYEHYRYMHIEIGDPDANWVEDRIMELALPYLGQRYELVIPASEYVGNIDAQYPDPITVETYRDGVELSRIIARKRHVLASPHQR